MELITGALGIILVIAVIVVIIKFIKFLFTNLIVSRIISAVCALISIIVCLLDGSLIAQIILSAATWCFFIGPVIFDVHYDPNELEVYSRDSDGNVESFGPKKTGGFLANVIGSLVTIGIIYFISSESFPAVLLVLPIILLLLDAYALYKIYSIAHAPN